ncbi:MAG: GWxTD domain-containing protein [Acidobacteria bacterium]|nr:GWxTD domain-containing protein [Acidobacteriota bacterium]
MPARAVHQGVLGHDGAQLPAETNPARDLFWTRVEEATARYEEEALPGWISDRGRIYVLRGAPKGEEIVKARIGETDIEALIWTFERADGVPERIAFRRYRLTWLFTDAEPDPPAAAGEPWLLSKGQLGDVLPQLSRHFRNVHACAASAEQLADQARTAWRQSLWQISDKLLANEDPGVKNVLEPAWSFFPAEGDATFTWLRVPLASKPAEGSRLVAILRSEGQVERFLGTDEFPFEIRPNVGGGFVAQAARALPPGRYAVAIGLADEAAGTLEATFAGEQILVRLPEDSLRLTSVVLAESVAPLSGDRTEGPFRFGGFDVVPRTKPVIRHGEALAVFYQVLGATTDAAGRASLSITYQFHIKRGTQWIKAGKPVVQPDAFGATQAWSTDIVPQWPLADYKLEITIKDNKTQGTVSSEVPFRVEAK